MVCTVRNSRREGDGNEETEIGPTGRMAVETRLDQPGGADVVILAFALGSVPVVRSSRSPARSPLGIEVRLVVAGRRAGAGPANPGRLDSRGQTQRRVPPLLHGRRGGGQAGRRRHSRHADERYGPRVQGAGAHHNPTLGPTGSPRLQGHVFVVLGVLLRHPSGEPGGAGGRERRLAGVFLHRSECDRRQRVGDRRQPFQPGGRLPRPEAQAAMVRCFKETTVEISTIASYSVGQGSLNPERRNVDPDPSR